MEFVSVTLPTAVVDALPDIATVMTAKAEPTEPVAALPVMATAATSPYPHAPRPYRPEP